MTKGRLYTFFFAVLMRNMKYATNKVTNKRRALAGNIILSGGMAKMPGLQRRLLQEIKNQLLEERYEKLENLDVSDLSLNDPI